MRAYRVRLSALSIALCAALAFAEPAFAGTTGAIGGHVIDSATQQPLSGVKVSITSPSQSEVATTDATGAYAFVSLSPDTYTVTATLAGYDPTTLGGINVLVDQNQTLTIVLKKAAAVIGRVAVTGTGGLVRAGVTSNVYSVSGAQGQAATALAGAGNLNSAYGQMASVPGVSAVQGQQGWYQPIYIRGGDLDQVGWEFDGIPVNRTYDNAPQTFLSNLGQQELQVYTGGTSPNADSSGIAGYVNQVIKRGTNPGFQTLDFGMGGPAQYNKVSYEVGEATPDQRFSYYIGSAYVRQAYRYIDQFNGASFINQGYFYPINTQYFGNSTNVFTPGNAYGIADTYDHENVVNIHQRVGTLDEVQLLYMTSYLYNDYYSSQNDLGGPQFLLNNSASTTFADMAVYNGPLMQAPNPNDVVPYLFPSTPHAFGAPIQPYTRDSNSNSDTIMKLQYQHNFSTSSYLRVFGFGDYSNWFIHGPESQALFCCYGAELADYELPSHQYGGVADYSNQINDKNLITISALYETTRIQRYTTTGGFPGNDPGVTSLIDASGLCYDSTGTQVFCVPDNPPTYRGPGHGAFQGTLDGCLFGGCTNLEPGGTPASCNSPGGPVACNWVVTESAFRANLNRVNPVFTAVGLNDTIKPSDRVTLNIGARVENYKVNIVDNTSDSSVYPARTFWYAAYNREFCFGPGYFQPLQKTNSPQDSCAADWPLTGPVDEVNTNPSSFSHTEFQPRFGVSYQADPDNVLRFSAGIYSRPASTREASWNVVEQNLPAFLGVNFAAYGQFTPNHDARPDRSTNFDFSWEHRFAGTDASLRITPFYRSTQDQVQQTVVNALSGLFASFNTGRQVSDGVEVALQKGSFARDGWAASLAYTYTHSQIRYNDFANGRNVINLMNNYVQLYNSYTSGCVGAAPTNNPSAPCGVFGDQTSGSPYISAKAQPLFDPNAWYAPYDLIPVPWAAGNGYEVPDTATLLVNYKQGPLTITPSFIYSSGSVYGSPLSWNDDITGLEHPSTGTIFPGQLAGNPLMIPDPYTGRFDNFGDFKQPSRYTLNMALGYQVSPRTHALLTVSNLIDRCIQRGYAWDYSNVCAYSTLPSSFLTPTGGTVANAHANGPIQLAYPYAMWLNNNNTGFVGVKLPVEATFELQFKM
jgi:Carboxypeptidase regulatory-like domain/TonB dependent receptor